MPLGLRAPDTMTTPAEGDEEGDTSPGDTAPGGHPAGVIDTYSDDLEDTTADDEEQPNAKADLVDLVTIEAHIWRVALLEVGHDLTKIHQWIVEHDRPIHYHTDTVHHIDRPTFDEAYDIVRQEIASKYDYGNHPLPLPPTEEEPNDEPTTAIDRHNWRINQISTALGRIQEIDFEHYSNITGDWTSPRKLRDLAEGMIHKLKGNLR